MIINLLSISRESVMIGISIFCALMVACAMIPKAIRHRKQIREDRNSSLAHRNQKLDRTSVEKNDEKDEMNKHSTL